MNSNIISSRLPAIFYLLAITFLSCNDLAKKDSKDNVIRKDSLPPKETVNPYTTHDQSPLDMSYYPKDYPVLRMNGTDSSLLVARVMYSRPQKKGREIFGNSEKSLVHYGKEWRLGANEATEIAFFKPVEIAGKKIPSGNYIVYCIPYPDKWTIVLNSNLYTWGLHMDASKDLFKVDIPAQEQFPLLEDFTIVFEPAPSGANMIMAWDHVKTILPISFSK